MFDTPLGWDPIGLSRRVPGITKSTMNSHPTRLVMLTAIVVTAIAPGIGAFIGAYLRRGEDFTACFAAAREV